MKHIMLVNAVHKEQMRMATVDEKGKLIEFNIQMAVREPITGNIYKGKVLKVERGLQAAFVDYGGVKDGFLPLRDVSPIYLKAPENGSGSGRPVLKSGQEIIVQVVREVTGNKGALLTSYISLPGRYLVLLPNKLCGGISRKIESEEDRKKIKSLMEQIKVPEDMGFIVRTAGINRTKQEIQRDYQFLMRLWKILKRKPTAFQRLISLPGNGFRRAVAARLPHAGNREILVDDLETFRKMRAYLKAVAPRHLRILKQYKEKIPIFDRFELEEQIREIYQERVELKSGGYIIINPTEAMITIDVNSGRGSNKRNIEETAFKTNLDACEEIARQLRLRDLGGLIVIDFIDMIDKKHVAEVEKAFKKALSMDRSRIQLSRISKFGLLELSRQKKQSTIQEISYITCPYCKGSGLRPSLEYASLGAFRTIESEAVKGIYSELKVSLPHEIAQYILNKSAPNFSSWSPLSVSPCILKAGRTWCGQAGNSAVGEGPSGRGERHAGCSAPAACGRYGTGYGTGAGAGRAVRCGNSRRRGDAAQARPPAAQAPQEEKSDGRFRHHDAAGRYARRNPVFHGAASPAAGSDAFDSGQAVENHQGAAG
jgi:ribonuclease E